MEIPTLKTSRTIVTIPTADLASEVVSFFVRNQAHFAPWDPIPPQNFYTQAFWEERMIRAAQEFQAGTALRLMILKAPQGPVIGQCNFTQICRHSFQACYLGYGLDQDHVGQGIMTEALQSAIAYVFGTLKLHRIMANYLPTNEPSGRLLRRLGFTVEGYARDYLFIKGAWRDHILTALTNPDPSGRFPQVLNP